MARYVRTGILPQTTQSALYGDFSNVPAYHEALNRVREVEEEFLTLPATIRDQFDNDPDKLIKWVNNPENERKAVEFGLIPKKGTNIPPTQEKPLESNARGLEKDQNGQETVKK